MRSGPPERSYVKSGFSPAGIESLEAINAPNIALQRYEGTVLLVTHDHDLIDEVATRLWVFHEDNIEDFQGGWPQVWIFRPGNPRTPNRQFSRRENVKIAQGNTLGQRHPINPASRRAAAKAIPYARWRVAQV